jgi:NADPH-dependent curcumin reductase CurA
MAASGTLPRTATQYVLAEPVVGSLRTEHFRREVVPLPAPEPGEVLVGNHFVAVDPVIRSRMDHRAAPGWAYRPGDTIGAVAVGVVLASSAPDVPVGARVLGFLGFRDYATATAAEVEVIDPLLGDWPIEYGLTALGNPGLTAWVGVSTIGQVAEGETVFVSGAAGGIGSLAGQIARLRGARVIGSAGTDAKVRWLTEEVGFDAAFNYREGSPDTALSRLAPDGIDVYFDNTGGPQLEAALRHLRRLGRAVLCGAVSGYDNGGSPLHIANVSDLVRGGLTIRGYVGTDHRDTWPSATAQLQDWLRRDLLRARYTVLDGLDRVPEALGQILRPGSSHTGKLLVDVRPSGADHES